MSVEHLVQDLSEFISQPILIEKFLYKCSDINSLERFDKIIKHRTKLLKNKIKGEHIKEQFYNNTLNTSNHNNVFTKVCSITPEFSNFLKISPDRKISRNEANKMIYTYIWDNDLVNFNDATIIVFDHTLKELFQTSSTQTTYIKLNTFIAKLFIK